MVRVHGEGFKELKAEFTARKIQAFVKEYILFADDTTLQLSSKSLQDLYDLENFELSKIEDWFKANKLTLNASKTKYILFKNKKKM